MFLFMSFSPVQFIYTCSIYVATYTQFGELVSPNPLSNVPMRDQKPTQFVKLSPLSCTLLYPRASGDTLLMNPNPLIKGVDTHSMNDKLVLCGKYLYCLHLTTTLGKFQFKTNDHFFSTKCNTDINVVLCHKAALVGTKVFV